MPLKIKDPALYCDAGTENRLSTFYVLELNFVLTEMTETLIRGSGHIFLSVSDRQMVILCVIRQNNH